MWQNIFATTNERISYLFTSQEFSDVTFIVGGLPHRKSFPCHRLILAMSSEVFAAMFYGSLRETGPEVIIPDTDPDAFQSFLCFVYTDEVDLQDVDNAVKVYWLADKYMVTRLKTLCCNYLARHLSSDTICEIYELAKLANCHSLTFLAWKYIVTNAENVVKSNSFQNVGCNTVKWLVSRRWLNVASESSLFNALVSWAKSECSRRELDLSLQNQRFMLEPVISEIRFLAMTSSEFVKNVVPKGILTQEECLVILENLVEPRSASLPQYFSKCKKSRNQYTLQNGPESVCTVTCEETIAQICSSEARVYSNFTIVGQTIYIVGVDLYLSKKRHGEIIKTKPFDALYEVEMTALLTVTNRSSGQIMACRLNKLDSDQFGNSRINFNDPICLHPGETCEIILDIEGCDGPLYWCKGRHMSTKEFDDNVLFTFQEAMQLENEAIHSHFHKILFWTVD